MHQCRTIHSDLHCVDLSLRDLGNRLFCVQMNNALVVITWNTSEKYQHTYTSLTSDARLGMKSGVFWSEKVLFCENVRCWRTCLTKRKVIYMRRLRAWGSKIFLLISAETLWSARTIVLKHLAFPRHPEDVDGVENPRLLHPHTNKTYPLHIWVNFEKLIWQAPPSYQKAQMFVLQGFMFQIAAGKNNFAVKLSYITGLNVC